MLSLSKEQILDREHFIDEYIDAENAASGSEVDSNANVSSKNIATMGAEIWKPYQIKLNRKKIGDYLNNIFSDISRDDYISDLNNHYIYTHDETGPSIYCSSISMYPFLIDGMTKLNGESRAPKHLSSFCGSFINLIFYISSQICGAVAAVEFLAYFAHFARKDYGDDWFETKCNGMLDQFFSLVVYTLNQPAMARGAQSVFFNVSIFDKNFFEGIFGDFYYPDGSKMIWEDIDKLQRYFVAWFREERKRALLTFPVVTLSALVTEDHKTWKDEDYLNFAAEEYAKGSEFFIYTSDSVDSLSSCCRLRNAMAENEFSYTLGAGGIQTGSKNVITLNVNRIIQKGLKIEDVLDRVYKYQIAHNEWYYHLAKKHMLTIVDAGFVDLDKLYLTIGLNGVMEAAEYLGMTPGNNEEYVSWCANILGTIKAKNKEASAYYSKTTGRKVRFNTELVPAENLGVKNAKWDKKDGLKVPRACYNSYLYPVESTDMSLIDKLNIHGSRVLNNLDGGAAVHWNNFERLSAPQYKNIFNWLAMTGSNYFCENVPKACCTNPECGYIHPNNAEVCPKCGAKTEPAVRIIGYLKKVSSFSSDRQKEYLMRAQDRSFIHKVVNYHEAKDFVASVK